MPRKGAKYTVTSVAVRYYMILEALMELVSIYVILSTIKKDRLALRFTLSFD